MWKTRYNSLNEHERTTRLIGEDNRINSLRRLQQRKEEAHKYKRNSLKCVCFLGFSLSIVFIASLVIYKMAFEKEKQTCQCTVIPMSSYLPVNYPTYGILDTYAKMECDADGVRRCRKMCTSLAQRVPSIYRKKICVKQGNVDKYQGRLHYRPCSQSAWLPAEMLMTVCCKDRAAYLCPRHERRAARKKSRSP